MKSPDSVEHEGIFKALRIIAIVKSIVASNIHFVIKSPKLVQMIVTMYRVHTGLKSPHCQFKIAAKNQRWPSRNSVF